MPVFRMSRKNQYKKSRTLKKKREGRKKRLYWGLLAAVFTAMVTGFAFFAILVYDVFTQSPYFAARTIDVQGANRLSKEEIIKTAGLPKGVNILSVSLTQAHDRLIAHPWISKARVSRNMPDQIAITVCEREAMAVLDMGERFLLDTNGEIFTRCNDSGIDGLPVVTGLKFSDISVAGERMSAPYSAAVRFLQARKKHDWALPTSAISRIHIDRDMGLTLVSDDPKISVRFGYGGYPEKLMRLNYVLFSCGKQMGIKVALIDIIDVDRVVVRPREEV